MGMSGGCCLTKEINDKLKEREKVRRSEGTHTEAFNSLNEEVSWLRSEVKRGIWQLRVLEAKGTSEMWRVLKVLTESKPNNNTRIVTDNGNAYVVQRLKANAFKNMSMWVSSLKLAKED